MRFSNCNSRSFSDWQLFSQSRAILVKVRISMLEKQAFILHKIFKIFKKTCFYSMLTFKQIFNTSVVSAKFLLHDMHEKVFFLFFTGCRVKNARPVIYATSCILCSRKKDSNKSYMRTQIYSHLWSKASRKSIFDREHNLSRS